MMADLVARSAAVYLLPTGTPSECDFQPFSVETICKEIKFRTSKIPN